MNRYTIHLLALPNVQTTKDYSLCGFCTATRNFAQLLKELGHEVILYASEENDAPCDELVTVITKEEQEVMLANTKNAKGEIEPTPYQYAYIEAWSPIWQYANARMIREIAKRKQPRDFICSIGGDSQRPVAEAHPDLMFVEYSIGYTGSFSKYRVFESHAWRHHTYGAQGMPDGRFFDTVIPCFYDPSEFPFRESEDRGNFVLYVGRYIERKGIRIACQAAKAAGVPLKLIGHGDSRLITYGEDLGSVSAAERNEYMSRARAVLTPTIYVEPFNQVAVEAQLCGTPVISTDFGGFTETVIHGETGYRCNYIGEFVEAINQTTEPGIDYDRIRHLAIKRFSIDTVKEKYQAYFDRLMLLWGKGFDTV